MERVLEHVEPTTRCVYCRKPVQHTESRHLCRLCYVGWTYHTMRGYRPKA